MQGLNVIFLRFAFLDFVSPELATAALVDPRNYSLDGRRLKLEFASPDAVRRGGNLGAKPKGTVQGSRAPEVVQQKERQKPGAALSDAKREMTAIVKSEGKRIVF